VAEQARNARVVAVVVTWNREELLVEALAALRAQSRPVDGIVVVDNHSDTSVESLVGDVHFVRLPRNVGGAGGFAVGIEEAVRVLDADFVWLMDDDTIPTSSALDELLRVVRSAPASARLFGSRVEWTDGRDHPMNTPRVRPFASKRSIEAAARHDAYPVRSISFVSLLVDVRAIADFGLPVADYFLWNDDFEYTTRILRKHSGFIATRSVVVHKTKVFGSTDVDPGARFRFEVRNKFWLLRHSPALAPAERVIYSGATAVAWVRTIAGSSDREVLFSGLRAGMGEALAGSPRPNAVVLSDAAADVVDGLATFDAIGGRASSDDGRAGSDEHGQDGHGRAEHGSAER
jgi:rhamnopyranosyl-N-acetylglucosaminyl-diphospho-decaprenol beta-1,3/1,4-galactofuranosyltransferase